MNELLEFLDKANFALVRIENLIDYFGISLPFPLPDLYEIRDKFIYTAGFVRCMVENKFDAPKNDTIHT